MNKIGKYAVYGLLVCLALILIPAGLLLLLDTRQRIKTDRYYAERPILHAMRSVHNGVWTNDSEPARSVLLQHVPLGTETESAVSALSRDSFGCSEIHDQQSPLQRELQKRAEEIREKLHAEDVQTKRARLNCQLLVPERLGHMHWIIDFSIDEGKRLLGVKVAIWNISL